MPSFYDSEAEEQKRSGKVTNIALPILAALEAIGTSIATKGRNPSSHTLGVYKDVQSGREAALERALGRDKDAASSARDTKLLGFQEASNTRAQKDFDYESTQRTAEADNKKKATDRLLGSPAEMDPAGKEIRAAVPGIPGLTDLDKAAIAADPIGWMTNKLKPQSMQFVMGEGGLVQIPKAGGQATTVTTPDGKAVTAPPPRSTGSENKPPAGYRWAADGSLEAIPGGPAADKADKIKQAHEAFKAARVSEIDNIRDFSKLAKSLSENKYLGGVTGAGALGKYIPGSPWADANTDVERLISMGAIESMAKMKRESPTGSTGFGALSAPELKVIQDSFAALKDKNQSPEKMRAELKRVVQVMDRYLQRIDNLDSGSDAAPAPGRMGAPDRKALARQALNDPEATPEEKAQAQKILAGP